MSNKIKLSEIQPIEVNSACLVWMTKFVRELKAQTGTVIRMQDEDVLVRIIQEARNTDNEKLLEIYDALKLELKTYLNSSEIDSKVLSRLMSSSDDEARSSTGDAGN